MKRKNQWRIAVHLIKVIDSCENGKQLKACSEWVDSLCSIFFFKNKDIKEEVLRSFSLKWNALVDAVLQTGLDKYKK